MGKMDADASRSYSRSSSQQHSEAHTSESALSQTQLAILQQRQAEYNQFFFPELVQGIQDNSAGSASFSAHMGNNAQQVNSAFNSAQQHTNQMLSQQGMLGDGNTGITATLRAQNERARASSLANAYYNQLSESNQNRGRYLQLAAGLSPQPTQVAPFHQSSTSNATSSSRSGSWSAGVGLDLSAAMGAMASTMAMGAPVGV